MKFLAKARRRALTTSTIISFSLTFALAGFALLMGLLPQKANLLASSTGSVETGVVLLVVPLVALVAAMLFEAARLALRGPISIAEPKPARPLRDWKPGHGEG
jgi:uncharacterized membrane protein